MSNTISWSEIATFTACRMKHHWAYRRQLQSRERNRAPWIGTCGHVALAAILQGVPWKPAVDEWHHDQLKGRLRDDQLELLSQIVADVKAIIPRYLAHYPDQYRALRVERRFEVPLRAIRTKLIGYWDGIVEDTANRIWVIDHKWPKQLRPREDIDLDGQIGVYDYAARAAGFKISGIIYNQILSTPPKQPEMLKSGKGLSKADIKCDWPTYRQAVVDAGFDPRDYEDMRMKLSTKKFFDRYFIYRSPQLVDVFIEDIRLRVRDARKKDGLVYMSPSAITCRMCDFRALCHAKVSGADVEHLVTHLYEPRDRRKPDEVEEQLQEELDAQGAYDFEF